MAVGNFAYNLLNNIQMVYRMACCLHNAHILWNNLHQNTRLYILLKKIEIRKTKVIDILICQQKE